MTQPAVNVDTLPGDDVYPDLIDSNAAGLRKAGKAVAARGTRVNAHWKKLGAHYGAPETESLVAKLAPAETAAATFGTRMGSAATALEAFAEEARGIKKRAEAIRARAKTFLDGVVAHGVTKQTYIPSQGGGYTKVDHERWDQDSKAVAENDAIIAEIEQLANDLEAAEARCANSITGAVGADPVTGPGTSVDWTSVPAGTATPWGVKMGHRNETNDEAIGRGMLTGLIGLETSLMAVGGWQNKTMTYDKITGGGFDPFALDHSFALQGQALLGIGKFAAGVSNLVNPVYAPLTLLGLRSKGPLGDYSRATTGTVIEGGKSFLVWDKWKNDPYAAGGELTINLLSLAIPGGGEAAAPVEVAARVGVRAGEETAEVAGRAGLDAAAGSTARAGSEAAADAAGARLSHVPVGVDARPGLGHAEAPPTGAPGTRERVAGMGDAPGDFKLEGAPVVNEAPAPRTPQHVENPEPAADRSTGAGSPDVAHKMGTPDHDARATRKAPVHAHAPKPAEVPAAAEHPTPRKQDQIEAEVPARERELVKVGATAEHRSPSAGEGASATSDHPVRSAMTERTTTIDWPTSGRGSDGTGNDVSRDVPTGRSGAGDHPIHNEPDPSHEDSNQAQHPDGGDTKPTNSADLDQPGADRPDHGAQPHPDSGHHGDDGVSDIPPENRAIVERYERSLNHVSDWLKPMVQGRIFNVENWHRYPANEVYVTGTSGKRFILDSYVPGERIVSRKDSMLGEIRPESARAEIRELVNKYPSDGAAHIADVPSAKANPTLKALIGTRLQGRLVLEVPVQRVPVPREVLEFAAENRVQIVDVTGHRYR